MNRIVFVLLCAAACANAQAITATVVTTSGERPLSAPFIFADTPMSSSVTATIRLRNASGNPIMVAGVVTGSASFGITNLAVQKVLASNTSSSFEDFTLAFAPKATGLLNGSLDVTYVEQRNGCQLQSTDPAQQCAAQTITLSVLQGNGTPSQLVLSYAGASGSINLTPNSSTALDFGNVSTSTTKQITFAITNQSTSTLQVPAVTLNTAAYNTTAFALSTAGIATALASGASTSFTVTFAPGQATQSNATLQVGQNTYALTGTGAIVGGSDALVITYVDSTGVRLVAQGTTPIDFGQIAAGAVTPATLTFTVANPSSSFAAISVPSIVVSGAGFSLSNLPSLPAAIAPGQSITFKASFAPTSAGAFTAALAIGSRQFSLAGLATKPSLDLSLSIDSTSLTSQEQAHVSVTTSTAAGAAAIGSLTMTFAPFVSGVSDDPAVVFTATGGRQLQITIAQGATSGTYNGQASITFQTGATAGTITFTLTFPNQTAISKSVTINPSAVAIGSATAVRESPNLVLSVSGYDNTYSTGQLSFVFYDKTGKQINANPITYDASSAFHSFFFGQTAAGGAFKLQVTFPVVGDVTQVGSVKLSIGNSSGSSTATETFQ